MECPVCYRCWDSEDCVPLNLPCGHSFCEMDLLGLFKPIEGGPRGEIKCCLCQTDHEFASRAEVKSLVKNYAVIAYADTHKQKAPDLSGKGEGKQDQQKCMDDFQAAVSRVRMDSFPKDVPSKELMGVSLSRVDMSLLLHEEEEGEEVLDESNVRSTVDQFLDEEPPMLTFNQKCKEHPLEAVVAYNKLTYQYLCAKCVSSQNLHKEYYQVYPQVIQQVTERIEQSQKLIKYRKMQLEETIAYVRKLAAQNREDLALRVGEHVESLQELFDSYKQRQQANLDDALQLQEARTEDVCQELADSLEKIESDASNLGSIEYHEDSVKVFMMDIIEDLYAGLLKFTPEVTLDGLQIDVDIDDEICKRIDRLLTNSAELVPVSLPALDGSNRATDDYRQLVRNIWFCLSCGGKFSIKQVECTHCSLFRPLETFDNVLFKPEKVSRDEVEALKLRREMETLIIIDLEKNGEDSSKRMRGRKQGASTLKKHWYMISSDWLFKWKCFVNNHISKAVNQDILKEIRHSGNQRVGILPPGPISNYSLFV